MRVSSTRRLSDFITGASEYLIARFRGCEIYLRPHPEERALARVSKDGRESALCGHPSRRLLRKLLRMRSEMYSRRDEVLSDKTISMRMLFDPGHSLEERILSEQFGY